MKFVEKWSDVTFPLSFLLCGIYLSHSMNNKWENMENIEIHKDEQLVTPQF